MDPKLSADYDKLQSNAAAQDADAAQAKKRRAKGEAGEGNYVCGCGKAYLSYPALYTHIKTKHDGITPTGTTQPQTSSKSGRGRPKKGESGSKPKEEEEKEPNNDNNDNQMAYGGLLNFLKILETEYKYDDQSNETNGIVSAMPDSFNLVEKFPIDVLRPAEAQAVLTELDNISKTKNIGAEEVNEETGVKKTPMNRIFAIFIYLIGRHLKESFYREFVFFLMMFRRALNELGWGVRERATQSFFPPQQKELEFCAFNNGEYAPEISNDFITEKWSKYLPPQYYLRGFKVLTPDIEGTKNAVFLTQHFCNWLSLQGYTDSYLSINEDDAA